MKISPLVMVIFLLVVTFAMAFDFRSTYAPIPRTLDTKLSPGSKSLSLDWTHYHNYTEIVKVLLDLNTTYSHIVDVFSIGRSWENRTIYCIRLTNENITHSKPKTLFVGYHHARERISAELPLFFIVYTTTNYGANATVTHMLDMSEIYIVVALNVDSFDAVDINEWQRKNLHPFDEDDDALFDEDLPDDEDGDGFIEDLLQWNGDFWEFVRWEGVDDDADGLLNEDWGGGVDLNRNYGYEWNASVDSGSQNPCDEDFRGLSPFSELETQAIRDLALKHNFTHAISFHSGEECIVYPWGYSTDPPPGSAKLVEVAEELANQVGCWYGQSGAWYTTSGVWDDWMYGNRSVLAFTCEIYVDEDAWQWEPGPYPNSYWERGVFQYFNPSPSNIDTVVQRWMPVFFYIINRSMTEAYVDVAITSIDIVRTVVGEGYSTRINVTAANQGNSVEIFNTTMYANATSIALQEVTLPSGDSIVFNIVWDTMGWPKGNYTISAVSDVIPGEIDITDNTLVADMEVFVTIPGDVDADFDVDIYDVVKITGVYLSELGDPDYRPNSNINGDGIIDIYDVVICTGHYGQSWQP